MTVALVTRGGGGEGEGVGTLQHITSVELSRNS
jgi:hypothetical protein